MRAIECQEAFVQQLLVVLGLSLGNLLLGFSQILGSQLALYTYQFLNQRLVFLEHLVVALGHRTRDDERGTGIVNQHRVNLVDDGIVVGALHKVCRRDGHVVAQVVETELVVGTECDVGLIGTSALR